MDINQLESSLIDTLRKSDLANVGSDLSELAIDSALEEGVLKDVPVISTIRALWKAGVAVRDELFLMKLFQFLSGLHDVSSEERQQMIERLENDESYSMRVGEHIILLLERLDNMKKPALLAKAFRAYIRGRIEQQDLQHFFYVIDRVVYSDLKYLGAFVAGEKISMSTIEGFANSGLAWSPPGYATTTIKPTSLATAFHEQILLAE